MGARRRDPIPIHLGLNKSVEEVGLETSSAALYDCVVDNADGNIVVSRRPGLKEFSDTGETASVDGMVWWPAQEKMVAICNGKGFTIDDSDGNNTTLTGSFFAAGERAVMDDFGTAIYGADGANINKITTSAVTEMADGDAPTTVSHVAFIDKYLLANEVDTRKCHRSDVGAPDAWSSNDFSAESKYDNLRAIGVENLEVYLLGDKTLEVWVDTGADSPFARVSGGYIPSGTIAPYSFKFCYAPVNTWVWVDHTKSLVALNGRVTQNLSTSLDRYLQQDGVVLTDAAGDFFRTLGHAFYALHMPTQDETAVLDFTSGLWGNWAYWDSVAGEHDRWRGNCVALAPEWGKVLVGDRANGKIYELDQETYQDNGDTIKMLVRTGHIDRGDIYAKKVCSRVDFRAKKTVPGGGETIELKVRYRDNGETTWSSEKTVSLAAESGDLYYKGSLRRLGRYNTRQWEMYVTDNVSVALLQPIEDYEVFY